MEKHPPLAGTVLKQISDDLSGFNRTEFQMVGQAIGLGRVSEGNGVIVTLTRYPRFRGPSRQGPAMGQTAEAVPVACSEKIGYACGGKSVHDPASNQLCERRSGRSARSIASSPTFFTFSTSLRTLP